MVARGRRVGASQIVKQSQVLSNGIKALSTAKSALKQRQQMADIWEYKEENPGEVEDIHSACKEGTFSFRQREKMFPDRNMYMYRAPKSPNPAWLESLSPSFTSQLCKDVGKKGAEAWPRNLIQVVPGRP